MNPKIISTTDDLPGVFPLSIYQGATYSKVFTYYSAWNCQTNTGTPADLTGYTADMVIAAGQNTVVELSSGNGGITLGGPAGTITLSISATDTAVLGPVNAEYDLLLTDGSGNVTPLLTGPAIVRRSITGG